MGSNSKTQMPHISLDSIEHDQQRYETVGDYQIQPDGLSVLVSRMRNADYEFCVALHELVEGYLCYRRGISFADVTAFDRRFERRRRPGNTDEPGDSSKAPYRREHFFSTTIERLVAAELGVDWAKYERTINRLA